VLGCVRGERLTVTNISQPSVRVLLVEDSPSDASLFQELLQETEAGRYVVTVLDRLDQALERLRHEPFDVLLLDLSLPDSDGIATFIEARAAAPQVPIVLSTGRDDAELATEAVRHGIQDYLVKGEANGRQIVRAISSAIERKRTERTLQRMAERLHQAQKLESLGAIAAGVAHDFNNLFTVTLANAQVGLAELPPQSPTRQHLQVILDSTLRAAELSQQMLAYTGKQPLALERCDLSQLVRDASRMLEVSLSKRVRLDYGLSEGLPPVRLDATRLRQAIYNLVTNAAEAMGEREGVIRLVTEAIMCDRARLDAAQAERGLPEGLYVVLAVTDTGCGMDAETLEKAFDPFFSTKSIGRGLGLAVVQGIVRAHSGAILVESKPQKGTTIRLLLPPDPVPAQRLDRSAAPALSETTSRSQSDLQPH
jgi:signal transduction histidine kinase